MDKKSEKLIRAIGELSDDIIEKPTANGSDS